MGEIIARQEMYESSMGATALTPLHHENLAGPQKHMKGDWSSGISAILFGYQRCTAKHVDHL
jgi:hypothetical protein